MAHGDASDEDALAEGTSDEDSLTEDASDEDPLEEDASDGGASDGAAANRKYEDWPVDGEHDDEAKYVGMVEGGGAWFYNERNHSIFEREMDGDDQRLLPASDERSIPDEESLGETVERLGDELGWDALSEFARKHLERNE